MITAQPTPNKTKAPALQNGMRVPFFEPGGPTPLSAKAINPIVALVNAFANLQIVRKLATANAGGTAENSARFLLSDQNAIIELTDAPPGTSGASASVQLMQVVSDPGGTYITAKLCSATGGVFTATGSALNVAKPFLIRSVATLDQPYTAGVHILATQPIGGTGVTVSSVDVLWEDLNVDARRAATLSRRWRGTYDATATYIYGDEVQVFTGTSQGTFVCVASSPITATAPIYPTAGNWDMVALGVQITDVCSGGTKSVYSNTSAPY